MTPVREVKRFSSRILRRGDAKRYPVDQGLAPPDPDFTDLELLEDGPDGQTMRTDGGACRESNTGRDAMLIEEAEPVLPNKLAVSQEGSGNLT